MAQLGIACAGSTLSDEKAVSLSAHCDRPKCGLLMLQLLHISPQSRCTAMPGAEYVCQCELRIAMRGQTMLYQKGDWTQLPSVSGRNQACKLPDMDCAA